MYSPWHLNRPCVTHMQVSRHAQAAKALEGSPKPVVLYCIVPVLFRWSDMRAVSGCWYLCVLAA